MSTIQTKILKPKLGFSKTAWKCVSSIWDTQILQIQGVIRKWWDEISKKSLQTESLRM